MKLTRLAEISSVFLEEGLGFLTERKPRPGDVEDGELPSESELAQRLRRTLERLGPTFVKFGQMLATRVDLFDEHIIHELGKLHSHVTPFPNEEAREMLEAELGAPVGAIFSELSEDCVAAASIAQVYRGRLKGNDDPWVAVKVQRPGLEDTLLSDLDVLVDVSGFIDALVPKYRRSMVHKVAEEYSHRARLEIDFLAEATAMEQFGDVLETLPEFRIPQVYRELCTSKVLVMEWMEGTKLDELATPADLSALGFDPISVARSMLRLQLSMSYEHGVVHGDTHPGNVFLLRDGHIGLIDFGLNAQVPRALREKMLETLFYASSGRVDEAASCFAEVIGPETGPERHLLRAGLERGKAHASAVEAFVVHHQAARLPP